MNAAPFTSDGLESGESSDQHGSVAILGISAAQLTSASLTPSSTSDCLFLVSSQVQQPDPVRRGGRPGRLSRPLPRHLQIPGSPVRMRALQYVSLSVLSASSSPSQLVSMWACSAPVVSKYLQSVIRFIPTDDDCHSASVCPSVLTRLLIRL